MIIRRVAVTVRSAAGRQRTTGGLSDSDEGPRAGGAGCCFKQRYAAEVPGVLARKFQFLLSFLSKNTHGGPLSDSDGHSPRPQSLASAPRHSGAAARVSRAARVTCRRGNPSPVALRLGLPSLRVAAANSHSPRPESLAPARRMARRVTSRGPQSITLHGPQYSGARDRRNGSPSHSPRPAVARHGPSW